jgi:hypothetical protein
MGPLFTSIIHLNVNNMASLRSILILSTHVCLGLPSGLYPSGIFYNYPICIPLRAHSCYMPCPSHPPRLDTSNYMRVILKVMTNNFL